MKKTIIKKEVRDKNFDINFFSKPEFLTIMLIVLIAYVLRMTFASVFLGHPIDMGCFKGWSISAANDFSNFYSSGGFADYPPLYVYILFILGKFVNLFNIASTDWLFNLVLKLPSITADIITALMLYSLSLSRTKKTMSFLILILYLFNPVTILNSSIWGQVDSFFTMFILAGLIALYKKKFVSSSILLVLSVLMKPQGLFFIPILGIFILKEINLEKLKSSYKEKLYEIKIISLLILKCVGASLITVFIIILPFTKNWNFFWIIDKYTATIGEYKYASLNAFNLNTLFLGNWRSDSDILFIFSFSTWGYLFIGLTLLWTLYIGFISKQKSTIFFSSLFILSGIFILGNRMHERYLFPAMAIALAAFIIENKQNLMWLYFANVLTSFVNTLVVLALSLQNPPSYWVDARDPWLLTFSAFNVIMLVYIIYISLTYINPKRNIS
jgi:Gpi18-like mannosyltransferase